MLQLFAIAALVSFITLVTIGHVLVISALLSPEGEQWEADIAQHA